MRGSCLVALDVSTWREASFVSVVSDAFAKSIADGRVYAQRPQTLAAWRAPQLAIICREKLTCRRFPTLYAVMDEAVFSALANPVRRQVVMLLLSEERSAGSIAEAFDISRSAVSEHLGVLRQAGLVQETKAGRERIYSLNAQPLVALRDWLAPYEDYWKARLADLAGGLEETNE